LALKTQYEATLAERARIAQDLHDTLLQGFAGVTLQLKTAELALPDQPDVATETLLRVQRLARESLREARERVWDMQQTDLLSDDLATAIESLARDRAAGTNIRIAIVTKGSPRRLTRLLEDVAFRIAREAIGNAIRHANAQRIEVVLDYAEELFRLEVRDDGRGFTAEQADVARRQGHFGLSGMRTSAARVGGRCEAASQPDGGTLVRLELPLSESPP
jgi:signal transduction histidine kinase